jgi:hypothetical protein
MNAVLKIFNYRFYLREFLMIFFCYLLMEEIFSWVLVPVSVIIIMYEKILSLFIFGFMIYKFSSLKTVEKIYMAICTLILVRLVLESLSKYGTVFQQFTMFTVLFPVIFALFIKYMCRTMEFDLLEFMAKFHLFSYILFMALYGRGFSFSLDSVDMVDYGPFSGDSRIVHASHVFMMIIPFLWYLDQFLRTSKKTLLIPILFCVFVITVHQHRSVWSCTLFSLVLYFFASIRCKKQSIPTVFKSIIGTVVIIMITWMFVYSLFPGLIDLLSDRFSEIFDPAKEGSTGNFRIEQRDTYFELFLERPVFGWTFEGFEMPNPLVDWWPENTGQHFHEGYMEMLFYHGIVGLLFKYSLLFYLCFKIFSRKISEYSIILISFCISGLLFSFNYVLPIIFWGHLGLCLYYLEKDELKVRDTGNTDEALQAEPSLQ